MRNQLLILILIATAQVCLADMGLTDSAGKYIDVLGNQAGTANRNISDQLLQNALKHEAQGWSTLNVPMIVQSLQESLDGVKANNQSKEFGRATLGAVDSGSKGGHLEIKKYGSMSKEDFTKLSNTSSQHLPSVKGKLQQWGIKVSYDNKSISGDFGDYKVDELNSTVLKEIIMNKVDSLGLGLIITDEKIESGIQLALKSRQKIVTNETKNLKINSAKIALKKLKTKKSSHRKKPTPQITAVKLIPAHSTDQASAKDRFKELFPEYADSPTAPDSVDLTKQQLKATKKFERYQKLTEQRLGIDANARIGKAEQNIFKMVHMRYQIKRDDNELIEKEPIRRKPITIAKTK